MRTSTLLALLLITASQAIADAPTVTDATNPVSWHISHRCLVESGFNNARPLVSDNFESIFEASKRRIDCIDRASKEQAAMSLKSTVTLTNGEAPPLYVGNQ